jgi:hypothetical protein
MRLTIRLADGLRGRTVPIHIGELDESGRMIGGILVELRQA